MKKSLRFIMISVVLAVFVAACTNPTAAPESAPTPTTAPAASTTTAPVSTGGALSTVEIAKLIRPSVVHVQTEVVQFGFFMQPIPETGVGTGIIVDNQGNILTNNHVVDGAQKITVSLGDGRSFQAKLVGGDTSTDLAVIKIDADNLTPVRLGDSSQLQVGEDVVAIGHALDLPGGPTVSKGVVSALDRSIQEDAQTTIDGLIQTDAAINPGNSGGPLVSSRGEVIGINSAISTQGVGIGFAININDAKQVMSQLLSKGMVERGFLGIVHVNVTSSVAQSLGLPVDYGVLINSVTKGGPAEKAGLKAKDVITKLGDTDLKTTADLIRYLTLHKPGESVGITYYRGSTKGNVQVTLGSRPTQ